MIKGITTNQNSKIQNLLRRGSPIIIFLIIFIIMSLANDKFLRWTSFMNVFRQSSVVGIIACGQALVIMSGGIDLSVGAMMVVSGCLMAVAQTQWGFPPVLAVLLGVSAAILIGVLNGILTAKIGIFDFIATLGTQTTFMGVALIITGGLPISGINKHMIFTGGKSMDFGLPYSSLVLLFVLIISYIILEKTTLGRNILAIGGNKEAARVSGVNIIRTKIFANTFAGLCAGIAGFIMIGRMNSANALMGTGYELNSIAAVVIGGTSINGGSGAIGGTFIGVLTMGVLQTGMDLLGLSASWQKIVLGIVIIAVVTLDNYRRKKVTAD